MGEEEDNPNWLRMFQAQSTSTLMISSGSDGSPENSPTRTTFGKEEKGEKKVSSENVDDGDAAAQNKGKKATGTRRKSPSIQEAIDAFDKHEGPSMEEKQDKLPKRSTPKKNLVTLSSCCDASPGNSPSRAGTANEEEDSYTFKIEHGQQGKGKKSKVTGPKDGPEVGVAEEDLQDKLAEHSISLP